MGKLHHTRLTTKSSKVGSRLKFGLRDLRVLFHVTVAQSSQLWGGMDWHMEVTIKAMAVTLFPTISQPQWVHSAATLFQRASRQGE